VVFSAQRCAERSGDGADPARVIEVRTKCSLFMMNPDDACVPVIERMRETISDLARIRMNRARVITGAAVGAPRRAQRYVLIYAADEIGPFSPLSHVADDGSGLRIRQRYALCGGGRRYGGSWLGHFLSLWATPYSALLRDRMSDPRRG